jgi:hypothetical protein
MTQDQEFDSMKYFMAAEKIGSLLFTLDMTMDFMEEYKISPDEAVKESMKPLIDRLNKWLK